MEVKYNPLFDRKKPLLLAHRGFTPVAPENSLVSFRATAARGYWAIETDVHRTLDGILVCCHNFSLKKMYGADVKIEELNFSELGKLKIVNGNNVGNYSDEELRLPLFAEYLSICARGGCVPFIETKGDVVEQTLRMVDAFGIIDGAVLSSINFDHIEEARRVSDRVFIHHIFTTDEQMMRVAELGNGGVSYNYPELDEVPAGLVEKTHSMGVRLCLRAGDTPEKVRRMTDMGLDYIPTNCVSPADIG